MPTLAPPAPARKPRPARPTLQALTTKEFMHSFTNATLAAPDALMTALARPLQLQRFTDTNVFRAFLIFLSFGSVSIPNKCDHARCQGKQIFEEQYREADPDHHHPNASVRYQVRSSKCNARRAVRATGVLASVEQKYRMAFAHFLLHMLTTTCWTTVLKDMVRLHTMSKTSVTEATRSWLKHVQMAQREFLLDKNLLKVGGLGCTVVWDETAWSKD